MVEKIKISEEKKEEAISCLCGFEPTFSTPSHFKAEMKEFETFEKCKNRVNEVIKIIEIIFGIRKC